MKAKVASSIAFLLAVQAMGLQLLCFCGGCALSERLTLTATEVSAGPVADHPDEHPCCAAARKEREAQAAHLPQVHASSCCDQHGHELGAAPADLRQDLAPKVREPLVFAATLPPVPATLAVTLARPWTPQLARGPPSRPPATPIYLQNLALLV